MLIGAIGHVTGKVGPGLVGEVTIEVRGGTDSYAAYGKDDEVIEVGSRIVVVEEMPPRSVRVDKY